MLLARAETTSDIALFRWQARVLEALSWGLGATAAVCLILVLCGVRLVRVYEEPIEQGVGIAFAIDVSTSMWAEDMAEATSRLDVAKTTVARFLAGRSDDVGLVSFAGEALTRLPLTHDLGVVGAAVNALQIGLLIDGTDVAGAIAAGAGLLRDAPHVSKVLILITDGAHNKEGMSPAVAARAASMFDVRIFTITIGRDEGAAEVDMETVFTQAARITGGQYFRATHATALDSIYLEIDRLAVVSDDLVVRTASTPLGVWLLVGAALALLSATAVRASRWGVVP